MTIVDSGVPSIVAITTEIKTSSERVRRSQNGQLEFNPSGEVGLTFWLARRSDGLYATRIDPVT